MFNDPQLRPLPGSASRCATQPMVLRVGLIGIGTVGGGTWAVLRRNQALIAARAGRSIEIIAVAARNLERAGAVLQGAADVLLTSDPLRVATHPDVDVVVEAAGGTGPARDWVLAAIAHGKHVVTANKALLAVHGQEIFAAAAQQGVAVAYEGAVAASLPIIKALREGLTANRIDWVAGIINGTSNFILTRMRDDGVDFAAALAEAQALGYAEADPAFDVDGVDAAHKAALLAANAFGMPVRFDQAHVEGIRTLQPLDVACARQLGFCIKLLGIARRQGDGVQLRVHPALVPAKHLLAQVDGSMNGVLVKADASGVTMYYGAGAGAEQTASAVIADLVDVARLHPDAAAQQRVPALAFHPWAQADLPALPVLPMGEVVTCHYLRMPVATSDAAQALAGIAPALERCQVPVQSVQLYSEPAAGLHVLVLTQPARDADAASAAQTLQAMPACAGPVVRMRVERLD